MAQHTFYPKLLLLTNLKMTNIRRVSTLLPKPKKQQNITYTLVNTELAIKLMKHPIFKDRIIYTVAEKIKN